MRSLVYHVNVSIDGFIADTEGSADRLVQTPELVAAVFRDYPETCPAHVRDLLGVAGEARHFDTVVMGANTHQPALDAGLTSAYPHLAQYVVTHRALPDDPTVTAVDDPVAVVRDLKQQDGLDVWLCGGGDLAGQLADEIDELHLKVSPVVLGGGVPLVGRGASLPAMSLRASRELPDGVLLNRYVRA